ncbi:uncharacterized protein LOC114250340 [Bombyx mandarina]|uniref:Uncharacterized protein LOC114250340 n=1 Tax=Bombyx mandarina TaxID=7092 RepID=A0A6J2KDB9_BOMMA|nr:uncharacterized protein LOC114250340 [Bombyx mandarina]
MYAQLTFLTSVLLLKVTATKYQCGGYVTQPVQTLLTSPIQCQPTGVGSFTPVAQFVIPAIIKPLLQPEPTVQSLAPAVPNNSGFPGFVPNNFPYGFAGPFGGMPPIVIESDDDDDDFTNLLFFLVLALGNRRCGFGGYGNCCGCCGGGYGGGLGGGRCGGSCGCDGYQNCFPFLVPFPYINPTGGASIGDIAGLLGFGAGGKALGAGLGIGAGGGALGYGAKVPGNRGSHSNDDDCSDEINLIIR